MVVSQTGKNTLAVLYVIATWVLFFLLIQICKGFPTHTPKHYEQTESHTGR